MMATFKKGKEKIGKLLMYFGILLFFTGCADAQPACGCDTGDEYYVCGDTVYESCTLTCDLYAYDEDCFTIGGNDITIDFNGYAIYGDSEGLESDVGVYIAIHNGTTLIDGQVHGFTYGVSGVFASYTKILGGNYSNNGPATDDANDNDGYNIELVFSDYFTIQNVESGNPQESIELDLTGYTTDARSSETLDKNKHGLSIGGDVSSTVNTEGFEMLSQTQKVEAILNLTHNSRYGIYILFSNYGNISGVSGSALGIQDDNENEYGIYLLFSEYNQIRDCDLMNWTHGIFLEFADNNNLTSNTLTSCYRGIEVAYSGYNLLSSNTATGGRDGIDLWISDNNTLTRNNCSSNWDDGIYIDTSNYNTIRDNTLFSNGDVGLSVEYECDFNTLTGNNMQGNLNSGADFYQSDNNTFSGNTVIYNEDGLVIDDSGYNMVVNNNINLNDYDGVYFDTHNNNNFLNRNTICYNNQLGGPNLDIFESNLQLLSPTSTVGDDNRCDLPGEWDDTGVQGCTLACIGDCSIDRCTPEHPCTHGQGDCDTDNDCVNSTCVINAGRGYGCQWWVDICVYSEYASYASSSSSSSSLESSSSFIESSSSSSIIESSMESVSSTIISSSSSSSSIYSTSSRESSTSSSSSSTSSSSSIASISTTSTVPNCGLNRCTPENPCNNGEGDCDTNADCLGGNCAINSGRDYACPWWVDICEGLKDT